MNLSQWLFVISGSLFLLIYLYLKLTDPFVEDSRFIMLLGKPGAGKSTVLTAYAEDAFRRHLHVFSSEPISVLVPNPRLPRLLRPLRTLHKKMKKGNPDLYEDEKIRVETTVINPKDLFRYKFPRRSVVLVDEIGVLFQNRRFKEFDPRLVAHFKRYRHDHVTYVVASQSMDTDVVIRRIVSEYWLLKKYMRLFIVARRLVLEPRKFQGSPGNPSTIEDDMVEDPKLVRFVTKGIKIYFIPKWAKMFDSYEIPEEQMKLRDIDYTNLPVPYPIKQKKRLGRQSGLLARLRVGVHSKPRPDDRQIWHPDQEDEKNTDDYPDFV